MGIQRQKKRLPGYTQAIEHLGYLNEGYELYTFNMLHSPKPDNPDVAAIKGFEHRIEKRYLRKEGRVWYADTVGHTYPDELTVPEQYTEGARKVITVNAYERSAEARKACIRYQASWYRL
ncbi:hypothetical protein [Enterobacter kobei]|uniref:hypothetical protein n=1 Tax=Enterobacter kobei TaxID=208224 RepID=UPI003F557733